MWRRHITEAGLADEGAIHRRASRHCGARIEAVPSPGRLSSGPLGALRGSVMRGGFLPERARRGRSGAPRVMSLAALSGFLFLIGACTPETSASPATYTPLPTYTPAPTPAFALIGDFFRPSEEDTEFMGAISRYRVANGQSALTISRNLSFLAAWRVQLKMLGFDLQQVPITQAIVGAIAPRPGPGYALREVAFGGKNIDGAFQVEIGTPEGAFEHLRRANEQEPITLLHPLYEDIGASLACDGSYCAYVVIFGSTKQLR